MFQSMNIKNWKHEIRDAIFLKPSLYVMYKRNMKYITHTHTHTHTHIYIYIYRL